MNLKPNVDTEIIANRLRKLKAGEHITHEELSAVIRRDVTNGARSIVTAARKVLLGENIRIGPVRGVGYYRMSAADVANSSEKEVSIVGRAARRSRKRIEAIHPEEWNALTPEEKSKQMGARACLGAISHFSKPTQQRQLAEACAVNSAPLALASTIEHFSKKL